MFVELGELRARAASFPLITKHLLPLVQERIAFPHPESSPLINLLELGGDEELAEVEEQLQRGARAHEFGAIFEESLGTNPHPDEKILDMLAEVRVAELLTDYFDDVWKLSPPRVAMQPSTCDFVAEREGERIPVEVKDLGGEDFKGMKPIGLGLGYGLSEESTDGVRTNERVLQDALLARVRSGETQIKSQQEQDLSLDPGAVAIVDRRAEDWLFTGARDRTFERLSADFVPDVVRCVILTTQAGPGFEVFPRDSFAWFTGSRADRGS